ncbi:MAG: pyridoxine 5'-phosphate synthase [Nitrospiraceae bacterium]|nr:pyridoxine 5'-phosphate synthase [Nitrospiraceae bacterium]
MAKLGVNVDHVATLRQARGGNEPDPVTVASLAELGGADGIVVHLREDRRHIQERDLHLLKAMVKTKLNMEMAATDEMAHIAMNIRPDLVTLVPERRAELTTEGGVDVIGRKDDFKTIIKTLHESEIPVSLFIDPSIDQVKAAHKVDADTVEIHTGPFANTSDPESERTELDAIANCVRLAYKLQLGVSVGHGLNYHNITMLTPLEEIEEYNIGHSIVARAVLVGFDRAVGEMKTLLV